MVGRGKILFQNDADQENTAQCQPREGIDPEHHPYTSDVVFGRSCWSGFSIVGGVTPV